MSNAAFVYIANDGEGLEFRWHGGEYIDVGNTDGDGEFHAGECINVWDHEKDEPTIPRTLEAFRAHCEEWLTEQ